MTSFVHCRGCGTQIHETAPTCPKCGAPQNIGNARLVAAQPLEEIKNPRESNGARPAETQSLEIDYSEVPFYRRRWFYLCTLLVFTPLTALIAITGPLYYQQKGEVKKFPTSARVTFAIIGLVSLIVVLLRVTSLLAGLGSGQGHACADDATTGLVKEIFLKDLVNSTGMLGTSLSAEASAEVMKTLKTLDLKISGVRTNGTQKSQKKLSCTASIDLALPAAALEVANDPRIRQAAIASGLSFEGNLIRQQVEYTSQLADNGREFFVELTGYEALQQVISLIGLDAFKSPNKQTAVPQPTVSAPTVPLSGVEQSVVAGNPPPIVSAPEAKPASPIVDAKAAMNDGQNERDSPPVVANLCSRNETVLFACTTGKKLISVCATQNLSTNAGQIFYRLAAIGQAPEMTYPEGNQSPKTAFKQGSYRITNDRSGGFLSFNRGDFRYVMYSGSGNVQNYSGVTVERAGKPVANLKCEGDVYDELYPQSLSKIGVPTDEITFSAP